MDVERLAVCECSPICGNVEVVMLLQEMRAALESQCEEVFSMMYTMMCVIDRQHGLICVEVLLVEQGLLVNVEG